MPSSANNDEGLLEVGGSQPQLGRDVSSRFEIDLAIDMQHSNNNNDEDSLEVGGSQSGRALSLNFEMDLTSSLMPPDVSDATPDHFGTRLWEYMIFPLMNFAKAFGSLLTVYEVKTFLKRFMKGSGLGITLNIICYATLGTEVCIVIVSLDNAKKGANYIAEFQRIYHNLLDLCCGGGEGKLPPLVLTGDSNIFGAVDELSGDPSANVIVLGKYLSGKTKDVSLPRALEIIRDEIPVFFEKDIARLREEGENAGEVTQRLIDAVCARAQPKYKGMTALIQVLFILCLLYWLKDYFFIVVEGYKKSLIEVCNVDKSVFNDSVVEVLLNILACFGLLANVFFDLKPGLKSIENTVERGPSAIKSMCLAIYNCKSNLKVCGALFCCFLYTVPSVASTYLFYSAWDKDFNSSNNIINNIIWRIMSSILTFLIRQLNTLYDIYVYAYRGKLDYPEGGYSFSRKGPVKFKSYLASGLCSVMQMLFILRLVVKNGLGTVGPSFSGLRKAGLADTWCYIFAVVMGVASMATTLSYKLGGVIKNAPKLTPPGGLIDVAADTTGQAAQRGCLLLCRPCRPCGNNGENYQEVGQPR